MSDATLRRGAGIGSPDPHVVDAGASRQARNRRLRPDRSGREVGTAAQLALLMIGKLAR
jgi:hypothetical protein